jgi:hypothetical protein
MGQAEGEVHIATFGEHATAAIRRPARPLKSCKVGDRLPGLCGLGRPQGSPVIDIVIGPQSMVQILPGVDAVALTTVLCARRMAP